MKTEAQRLARNARSRVAYGQLTLEQRRALYTPRTETERLERNAAERAAYRKITPEQRDTKNARYRRYYKRSRGRKIAERKILKAGRVKPEACEICGAKTALCFDHDHATEKFRGWICRKCNLALGYVNDDLETLRRMIAYLAAAGKEFGT